MNVLGVQTGNAWGAEHSLTAPLWKRHEPGAWVAPSSVFDALAVTTYFGYATVAEPKLRAALLGEIRRRPGPAVTAWLAQRLADPAYASSIPQTAQKWAAMKAVARKYRLTLIAYEGGQHVQQAFALNGLSKDDLATLTRFLTGFVRSPEMARLYRQLWDGWARVGDGPFMQFGDVGAPSKWGSWGLLSDLGDTNPRAELLHQLNRTEPSWFGDGGGTRYQQGVIRIAGDGGETLTGTGKTDFLVGGRGDDTFISGTGHDGINGGGGNDTVVLAGTATAYTLVREGRGYRLTGPGTSDFLINVESLEFDGGTVRTVAAMSGG